jgi:hypothetical protein
MSAMRSPSICMNGSVPMNSAVCKQQQQQQSDTKEA